MFFKVLISSINSVALMFGLTSAINAAPATAQQNTYTNAYTEQINEAEYMLSLVNSERKKNNLQPLILHKELQDAAQTRAEELCVSYSHTRPNGLPSYSLSEKIYSENIGYGYTTADRIFSEWMNNNSHRIAILNPEYKSFGAGHAIDSTNNKHYWTQLFGFDVNDDNISQLVTRLYNVFFNREPETAGFEHHKNNLTKQIKSVKDVVSDFAFSAEFNNNYYPADVQLDKLYEGYFGRQADVSGKTYWLGRMQEGTTFNEITLEFAQSEEYRIMCANYQLIA